MKLVTRTPAAILLALVLATGMVTATDFNIGTVFHWLGGGTVAGFADGFGKTARFASPQFCAVDKENNFYIPDWGNDRIRKVRKGFSDVTTWVGTLEGNQAGTGTFARLDGPGGIVVNNAGDKMFVNEYFNHQMRQIVIATRVATVFAGNGTAGTAEGTGTDARFNGPRGLAILKSNDDMFMMEELARRARKITAAAVTTTLAGQVNTQGTADGTGTAAQFSIPIGCDMSQTDSILWVADQGAHTVRTITQAGVVVTQAGLAGNAGFQDGQGLNVRFQQPFAIAVDPTGTHVFIGELLGKHVRRLNRNSLVVDTVINSAGVDEWATASVSFNAQTSSVSGLCFDSNHVMYIVGHHSVAFTGTRLRSRTETQTLVGGPATTTAAAANTTTAGATTQPPPTTTATGTLPPNQTTASPLTPSPTSGNITGAAVSFHTTTSLFAALVALIAGALMA